MSVHSKDRATWSTKLDRISELSAANKKTVFNNIGYLINAGMLKEQYQCLDGNKAIGIDNVTKASYGKNLESNIHSLLQRIRRGIYKPKPARITEIPKEDGSKRPLSPILPRRQVSTACNQKDININLRAAVSSILLWVPSWPE